MANVGFDKRGFSAESAPLDAHSETDSIVLNAPVADAYSYCSRFEELPQFITSLRDVQKIDETRRGTDINAVNAAIAENANTGMSEDVEVRKATSSFQPYVVGRPPFACDNGRV
jgi:uncharacterized membrane protein